MGPESFLNQCVADIKQPLKTCRFAIVALTCFLSLNSSAGAADHRDAPLIIGHEKRDINDIYAFQSPANPGNTVFIMTTNPFAGIPGAAPTTFESRLDYEFNIDTDGDAQAETIFRITFGKPNRRGIQRLKLEGVFENNRRLKLQANGATGQNVPIDIALGNNQRGRNTKVVGVIRAAVQDDPFFFDSIAFSDLIGDGIPGNARSGQQFNRNPGLNTFGPIDIDGNPGPDTPGQGPNVLAITLEIPSQVLGEPGDTIGIWAATVLEGQQMDRMAFPAINTALIPSVPRTDPGNNFPTLPTGTNNDLRDAYNLTTPVDDRQIYLPQMTNIIRDFYRAVAGNPMGPGVVPPDTLAGILLPDILPFQLGNANGFANLNGRRLEDDVIDVEFSLLFGGVVNSDNVRNDSTFQTVFPYIGPPNPIPQGPNPN